MDDELDPTLTDRFALLTSLPTPDTWARVATHQQMTGPDDPSDDDLDGPVPDSGPGAHRVHLLGTATPRRSRSPLLAVAGAFAVAGIGLGTIWYGLRPEADRLEVTSTPTATTAPTTTPAGRPAAAPTVNSRVEVPTACTQELARSLRQDLPADHAGTDHVPSASLAELVGASERIVRGQLISATLDNGGTRIMIKTGDSVATRPGAIQRPGPPDLVPAIWTPASRPPEGVLGASFVAVLTNDVRGDAPVVQPEGLWVACDDASPAVSVLATPSGPGWEPLVAEGPSLEHLWDRLVATVAAGGTLGAPSSTEPGAAIYDLRLTTGERFRLRLPEALAGDYTIIDDPAEPTVTLTGPSEITIAFEECDRWDQSWTENDHGSFVSIEDGVARACRIDSLSVEMKVSGGAAANSILRDGLDLRPIAAGRRSQSAVFFSTGGGPILGPLAFPDHGIIVTTSGFGAIVGVDAVTLAEEWRYLPAQREVGDYLIDGDLQPHRLTTLFRGSNLLFSYSSDGTLAAIDPATGAEQWELAFPGETMLDVVGVGAADLLLWSQTDDGRGPVLRRVDGATGITVWKAEGRANTAAAWSAPTVIDDVVVVLDEPDLSALDAKPTAGAVLGFSRDRGDLLWTLDLGDVSSSRDRGTEVGWADVDDGWTVLVTTLNTNLLRIDHRTGEVLWFAPQAGQWSGTEFGPDGSLALSVDNPSAGTVLLDPDTGRRLSD